MKKWLLVWETIYWYFTISVHLKSELIRGVAFGGSGLSREVLLYIYVILYYLIYVHTILCFSANLAASASCCSCSLILDLSICSKRLCAKSGSKKNERNKMFYLIKRKNTMFFSLYNFTKRN